MAGCHYFKMLVSGPSQSSDLSCCSECRDPHLLPSTNPGSVFYIRVLCQLGEHPYQINKIYEEAKHE